MLPPGISRESTEVDAAVARLREAAPGWSRAPLRDRIALAHALADGVARTAARAVQLACEAKRIDPASPVAGEEWTTGPYVTLRILRQLARSLEELRRRGTTPIGRLGEAPDGRLTARVFPMGTMDRLLFPGLEAEVHLEAGVGPTEFHESRGRFHLRPDHAGRVCLVLGAGNVNAIPATDVLTKLFNEGKVCLLKLNPVNAYLAPVLLEAFAPAIARGLVALVDGDAGVGAELCRHPGVDEIHVTGSDRTHDLIVWGPPGPERDARRARGAPLLDKPITSELGNVTPVLVVPGGWDERSLAFQAEGVAGMVAHNGSFNCIAAKMLVTPRGWPLRARFLELVMAALARTPARWAFYPGAAARHRALAEGRTDRRSTGGGEEGTLPWTLLPGLDPASADPAFTTEPFCSILSEVSVGGDDPAEFLDAAVRFANERLWGTLAATILVHPRAARDPSHQAALQRAIRALRYGTVTVDTWAGVAFALGTTPWGAYPGSTLADVQSGRGVVHDTLMLDRVEKCVLHHPAVAFPKPLFFPSHRTAHRVGERLVALEGRGGIAALPGVVAAAVRG